MANTSRKFRKIGILGGMGVEATLELMKRVHGETVGEDDQDHIPMFVDMNPQVPSRIAHLIEKAGPDPGPVLAEMALGLERAGAEALAMPCNTAHLYAPQIEQQVSIDLLNMPKLACAQVAAGLKPGDTVGILASPATNSSGLLGGFLAEFGITPAYPENETEILASIRRIKQAGASVADIALLESEAKKLVQRGAKKMIIGCSEFSLISAQVRSPIPVLDTLDVLVQAIIAFSGARAKVGTPI
ncbi:Aspartate racemase [Roseobacter fucihabitans]|uniref:Aspartate racemase n=1 Tax=Roseobacter fucihabitans TaxID=1537242 RepID=A0ABZ2BWI0_9RHOB|nr:amino acid racemase [Roseobacter litoralis]MBC6967095.1 Aspartate racemase [Roseobacter litoralis]